MPDTPPKQSIPHREDKPRSGLIGEAAQAVASYCLLPEPRSGWKKFTDYITTPWRGMHYESNAECVADEIKGKPGGNAAYADPATREHIMRHAREFAKAGVEQCQVRDFHDTTVVPHPYYGYRGADQQCHVTQDWNTAVSNRKAHPQTPPKTR